MKTLYTTLLLALSIGVYCSKSYAVTISCSGLMPNTCISLKTCNNLLLSSFSTIDSSVCGNDGVIDFTISDNYIGHLSYLQLCYRERSVKILAQPKQHYEIALQQEQLTLVSDNGGINTSLKSLKQEGTAWLFSFVDSVGNFVNPLPAQQVFDSLAVVGKVCSKHKDLIPKLMDYKLYYIANSYYRLDKRAAEKAFKEIEHYITNAVSGEINNPLFAELCLHYMQYRVRFGHKYGAIQKEIPLLPKCSDYKISNFLKASLLQHYYTNKMYEDKTGLNVHNKAVATLIAKEKDAYLKAIYTSIYNQHNSSKIHAKRFPWQLPGTDSAVIDSAVQPYYIVSFWSTWCIPCKQELQELVNLQKSNPNKLGVIAVSIDADRQKYTAFVKQFVADGFYFVYNGPSGGYRNYFEFDRIPYNLIIDKEGKVLVQGDSKTTLSYLHTLVLKK